jgi:general transcription factor 3C polypeptide 3 (transcription factor C subunit 4)
MRDGATSDSYRMFALLSNLCQSPVSWYTSGPAQKYILRQIKAMDEAYTGDETNSERRENGETVLDACVLMLYGHILFTSTSYTYALGRRTISFVIVKLLTPRFRLLFTIAGPGP